MSDASPKRYLLYCLEQNQPKPKEELYGQYGSFLAAAVAMNEMADSAMNLYPDEFASRSDFFRDAQVRVHDTLTNENIRIVSTVK